MVAPSPSSPTPPPPRRTAAPELTPLLGSASSPHPPSAPPPRRRRRHVAVVVLGDLGRSPRMQYHASSLLRNGYDVTLVGYVGEGLIPSLREGGGERGKEEEAGGVDPILRVVRMSPPSPPRSLRRGAFLPLYLALRLLGLVVSLIRALWFRLPRGNPSPVDCVLVQNPPSAPLLLVAWLYCRWRSAVSLSRRPRPGLVIDWHNLGFTMFDTLSDRHPVRASARLYERIMAPAADGHLCVTSAMRGWLMENFGLGGRNVSVLRDRPPRFFRAATSEERHALMVRLGPEFRAGIADPDLLSRVGGDGDDDTATLFTRTVDGKAALRPDRPALVVSSTSWTPDEDFGILLDACERLDVTVRERDDGADEIGPGKGAPRFPHVVVVVTGKGPQKGMYEEKISRLRLTRVSVLTMWLEAGDYPLLLGCADLGVSLHSSTSGIDLPMKVLDMFGCGVPVCALDFPCLSELVRDGENGRVFTTAGQLAGQMFDLLGTLGDSEAHARGELTRLGEGVRGMDRWEENWDANAKGVILAACPGERGDGSGRGTGTGTGTGGGDPPAWVKASALGVSFAIAYGCTKMMLTRS